MCTAKCVCLGYDLHPVLLVLAVVPAVPGLWHQQGDDVALGEAEQGGVIAGRVREDGLHPRAPVPLQPGRHGAGPGQRACLSWTVVEGREGRDGQKSSQRKYPCLQSYMDV